MLKWQPSDEYGQCYAQKTYEVFIAKKMKIKVRRFVGTFSFKNYVQIESFAVLRNQSALFGQKPRRLAFLLTISQKKAKPNTKNQN